MTPAGEKHGCIFLKEIISFFHQNLSQKSLSYLDTVSCSDDPPVGDDGGPTLVFELARLELSQRDLPRPLGVARHVAAHHPPAPPVEELAAADLGVVRVGVESVERPGAALRTDVVVLQRDVDLGLVLTDVIPANISQSVSQTQCLLSPLCLAVGVTELDHVLVQLDAVLLSAGGPRLPGAPHVPAEFLSVVEPAEDALGLEVAGAQPEGGVGGPGEEEPLEPREFVRGGQLQQVTWREMSELKYIGALPHLLCSYSCTGPVTMREVCH